MTEDEYSNHLRDLLRRITAGMTLPQIIEHIERALLLTTSEHEVLRTRRINIMLGNAPAEGTNDFLLLSPFEQQFLPSLREQMLNGSKLSTRQFDLLYTFSQKHGWLPSTDTSEAIAPGEVDSPALPNTEQIRWRQHGEELRTRRGAMRNAKHSIK